MVVKAVPEIFCFAKKSEEKKSEVKACYKVRDQLHGIPTGPNRDTLSIKIIKYNYLKIQKCVGPYQ